jgi:hypothetical protein
VALAYPSYQFDIYLDSLQMKIPRYPVDFTSLERAAAQVLPPRVHFCVAGGAGGKAIEHWDTLQLVGDPKNSAPLIAPSIPRANPNGMF